MRLPDSSKRLLSRVPKHAIVDYFLNYPSEETKLALTSIFPEEETEPSKTRFSALTHDQIIDVYEALPGASEADVQRLYDLHR